MRSSGSVRCDHSGPITAFRSFALGPMTAGASVPHGRLAGWMSRVSMAVIAPGLALLALMMVAPGAALGQGFDVGLPGFGTQLPTFDSGGLSDDNPYAVTATFQAEAVEGTAAERNPRRGRLSIAVDLAPEWHIYSLTQKKGGPTPTSLQVEGPEGVEPLGPFAPEKPATVTDSSDWPGLKVEEHEDRVVWTAPVSIAAGTNVEELRIQVRLKGLACRTGGACLPLNEALSATFDGTYEVAKPEGEYRAKNGVVTWRGELVPATVAPGGSAVLRMTAVPDDGYYVYAATVTDAVNATNFVLTKLGGLEAEGPASDSEILTKPGLAGGDEIRYHEGAVTWNIRLTVPEGAQPGEREIEGLVGYQACTDTSCRQPQGMRVAATLTVAEAAEAVAAAPSEPIALTQARYADVLDAAAETRWVKPETSDVQVRESSVGYSLPMILSMAIIGGLILNLMPCVLPVVGLKLMALVESAGDDKRRILSHNLWYSFGLLSVFWVLAALAIGIRLASGDTFKWGQQFTYVEFRVFMTLLVFVMALSFLGVWEIPLPGFASGRSSQQLQKKEGPAGAYFKGVFTTLLATPCSGPFLGAVFGFTLAASYPVIALVFTAVGLGMALPYILIGLMPSLVFFLPKPGPWMETFKHLMGFVLLGTVAFLFAGFGADHKTAVFVTLVGVWFACWMIGRVPLWDALHRRLTAWGGGVATAALVGWLAFRLLVPGEPVMPWEPYSEARLAQYRAAGRTVMIDFTADWCMNCKYNYNVALNTEQTAELIRELDAVPMLADWSEPNDEIAAKLDELQSASIPILAIYPGGSPDRPIVLRDIVTQSEVLAALRDAGPSISGQIATNAAPASHR